MEKPKGSGYKEKEREEKFLLLDLIMLENYNLEARVQSNNELICDDSNVHIHYSSDLNVLTQIK